MQEYIYGLLLEDIGSRKLVRWEEKARYNACKLESYLVYKAYKNNVGKYYESDTILLDSFKYKVVKQGIELEINNMIDMESKMPARYNFNMAPFLDMNRYPFSIEEFNKLSNGEIFIKVIDNNIITFNIKREVLLAMLNNIINGKSFLEYSIALKRIKKN